MLDSLRLPSAVFVASIKPFNGSNARPSEQDKNQLSPIILDVIAGTCPNKRVIAGTVAKRAGMIEGNTYLCKFEEIDVNEYGRQFRFSTVVQMNAIEILEAINTLGMPMVIEVVKNEPELTKSGNFSYPKGLTVSAKIEFDALTAKQQDEYLEGHEDIRVHRV